MADTEARERSSETVSRADPVLVSVIIPVYNDPEGISQTLDSLAQQTYPDHQHEVVVVDNDSTDRTRSVAREYCENWGNVTMELEDEIQSSYAARNTGIRASEGDICVFLDADMIVEKDWLESIVDRFTNSDIDYLGCNVEITVPPGKNTVFARYNRASGFPVQYDIEEKQFAPTCCLAVNKSLFDEVGMFDERLMSGGDYEFGNRVHECGTELHYAEDIVLYHPARSSFRSLIKKSLRQGRGVGQLQRYYPNRYGRPGIPPRPDGSHVEETAEAAIPWHEQLLFWLFTVVLLAARGVGYYIEVGHVLLDE